MPSLYAILAAASLGSAAAVYVFRPRRHSVYCSEGDHRQRLDAVLADLRNRPKGSKLSLHRRTLSSNTIRNATHKYQPTYFPVDLSSFKHIIEISQASDDSYVVCEAGIPFGDLLRELAKVGMTTLVVPELPGITVGGAIAGGGLESSSYKYGQVSDTVLEIECLTPERVICSPTVNSGLFYAISASYNTCALMTRVKLRIHPAPKYLSLDVKRYESFSKAADGIRQAIDAAGVDTIESLAYSPDETIVITGTHTDIPLYTVHRFNRHWDKWYYKAVRKSSQMSIPYLDYCFRYNYGSFWMAEYVLDMLGGDNLLTRFLFGALLDTKHLFAVLHSADLSDLGRMRVIQDCYVPIESTLSFLNDIDKDIGVYPLWLCPIKATASGQVLASHHMEKDGYLVNVGIYGRPRRFPFNPEEIHSRLVDLLIRYRGRSMLYAQTWHTPEQFEAIYRKGLEVVKGVRRKYAGKAEDCFFDLYEKVALSEKERKGLSRPVSGSEAEELRKVVKDILLRKLGLR